LEFERRPKKNSITDMSMQAAAVGADAGAMTKDAATKTVNAATKDAAKAVDAATVAVIDRMIESSRLSDE
jgi:hypothetical protein